MAWPYYTIRLAKKLVQFLSKKWDTFSPRTWWEHVFTVLTHYLLPPFRQLHNSFFPKLFIFLSKELFQVPFAVFQGIDIFFHKENFVKTEINGNPKVPCLVNTADESELPSQAVNGFAWSSKKRGLMLSWWEVMRFLLTNSGCFSSSAAFSSSNGEQYVLELTVWFSRRSS